MIENIAEIAVFFILPFAVMGGAAALATTARRAAEAEHGDEDPGIGTVRRLFIYVLALVGVTFAATGVQMIVSGAIDAVIEGALISERRQGLAVALAFTAVGTPAWLLFMMLAQRSVRAHAAELRSQARRLYVDIAQAAAMTVVAFSAVSALRQILGTLPAEGGAWGMLIAWGGVWAIHRRLAAAEAPPTEMTRLIDRLAHAFLALLGLVMVISGTIQLIAAPLSEAYDRLVRDSLLSAGWDQRLGEGATTLLPGGALWAVYWLRGAVRTDRLTTLWRVQVFVFGALTGVTLAIVPAASLLYVTLEWFIGVPGSDTAAGQFAEFPGGIATCLAGIAVWGYHRAVIVDAGDAAARSGPERVYRYVLAAAGLVTLAIGISMLIALGAEGLSAADTAYVVAANWWRNTLLTGLVLIAVGLPLWALAWRDTQRALAAGAEERLAPSRRVYVFGTVGVAVFALLVSLTILLYQVFQAVLGASLSLALLRDARWGLAVALTTGAIAYYHLLVLREDQAAAPETPRAPRRTRTVVLAAAGDASAILADLATIEGLRVRHWRREDAQGDAAALTTEQRAALLAAVEGADASRLLVVLRAGGGFDLVPYTEADPA